MKKNLLTIAFCVLMSLLSACKKGEQAAPAEELVTITGVDNGLVTEVLRLNTYSERKAAYSNILNGAERYSIWVKRNNDIIKSGVLNTEQLVLFKQVAAKVNLSLFTNKMDRLGLTHFFDEWQAKAKYVFTEAQLKYLIQDFVAFNKESYFQLGVTEKGELASKYRVTESANCGCSLQSDWCGSQGDCMMIGCGSEGLCGTFLIYQCNGQCSRVIIGG